MSSTTSSATAPTSKRQRRRSARDGRTGSVSDTGTPAASTDTSATLRQLAEQLRTLAGGGEGDSARALLAPLEQAFGAGIGATGAPTPALQQAMLALASWTTLATQRGIARAAREATRRIAAGHPPHSLREALDLLVECGDEAWLEIAGDDDFARALGHVLNEYARARLGRDAAPPHRDPPVAPLDPPAETIGLEQLLPDPAQWLTEIQHLQNSLLRAADTLADIGSVAPGVTPRHEAWSDDIATLYRMGPRRGGRGRPPVLLVYALVNREQVLDLEQRRSFVQRLLDADLDVWLLAWRPPREYRPEVTLERYVDDAIGAALQAVRTGSRRQRVSVIGICQGGTLALCHAARHPRAIHRLVTLVTPVDFHAEGFLLGRWLRHVDIDLLVDAFGNIPGAWLNAAFMALRPLELGVRKYLQALQRFHDPVQAASFLRMEHWLHDSPDQAGEAFRCYARDLVQGNGFLNATLALGGEQVDLRRLRCPVLNVAAARDHIVPQRSALALGELLDARRYRAEVVDTGHIGLFTSRRSTAVVEHVARFVRARNIAAAMAS